MDSLIERVLAAIRRSFSRRRRTGRQDFRSSAGMKLSLCWIALCLGLLSSSCVLANTTDGIALEQDPVDQIVPGTSTRSDVTRLLGPPDEIIYSNQEHDPLFEQAYRYRRRKTKQTALFLLVFSTFRSDTRYDQVMVFFDEAGLVEHIGIELERENTKYELL